MANLIFRTSLTPAAPEATALKTGGLLNVDIDGNFQSLNLAKLELSDAVATNTSNTVVRRDENGDFAAGTITADLSGNASTSTTLETARTLTIGATGKMFDGSANVSWSLADLGATASSTGDTLVSRDENGDFAANVITVANLNSTSDRNAKDNIQTIQDPLRVLNQLRGTSFNWKKDGKISYGVIAQELEQILPELVTTTEAGKAVAYTPLIAFLIEAIKQQDKRLCELETLINK